MDEHETALKTRSQALLNQPAERLQSLASTVMALGRLAAVLGEPMTSERQALMAESLSDLPLEAVLHAINAWTRGDSRHLSAFQQEGVRVGVFFPKPAELRAIATVFLRESSSTRRANEQLTEMDRWRAEAEADPGHGTLADVYRGWMRKRGFTA